jgi:hypothetical protein
MPPQPRVLLNQPPLLGTQAFGLGPPHQRVGALRLLGHDHREQANLINQSVSSTATATRRVVARANRING